MATNDKEYQRAWKAAHPEYRDKQNEYRRSRRIERRDAQRIYRAANKEIIDDKRFQIAYGITLLDYNAMRASQNNKCALCELDFADVAPRVDHDHKTGEIRGLLCHNCNVGLGHFKDSVVLILRAARYLKGVL